MREAENLNALTQLPIDYVGFIFYNQSKRFVENGIPEIDFEEKKKVGVFVNELLNVVMEKVGTHNLEAVQLHGNESAEYCQQLKTFLSLGREPKEMIKAFAIEDGFDFSQTKEYESVCDYFLFDTKGKLPGGNGYAFDWTLLENYQGETPFFLSGGIQPEHLTTIQSLNLRNLYAIDLNSGFEMEPAVKDISLLKKFIEDVRN